MTAELKTRRTLERAARDSCRRLIAFLAVRSQDVALAEDALADAFVAALESWPRTGIPQKPEAWLLTVARCRMTDAARHARVRAGALPLLLSAADAALELTDTTQEFPDERLKLLFVCTHPAIDAAARTPLMLQTVLGLDAARIAAVFLVKPAAMGQRLSRAKAKIRDARIPYEIPETKDLPERLDAVLEAIYAAYGSGWDDVAGADAHRRGLHDEALDLGRLLHRLLPAEPEVQGLLALMLHCEGRRTARRAADSTYVPLSAQDTAQWSNALLEEADRLLASAASAGRMGRFQLEAAIQSAHARRRLTGHTDWEAVALLYEGLVRIAPTLGALLGRAAALAAARGAADAWASLSALPPEAIQNYQPYWALAAHLLKCLGRFDEANAAYGRAIGLCMDPAVRAFLAQQAAELQPSVE